MKPTNESCCLPRQPLLLLAIAMLFTAAPMFGTLVWWVPVSFLGSLFLRFLMNWRGARLRSLPVKLILMAAGLGAIALSYHSLSGIEPGLSICLLLIAVKVLEAHTARDFHVLAVLGWFSCMTVVMISQSLATAVNSGIAFALVLAAVLQFNRRSAGPRGLLRSLRDSVVLILQAAPLVLALFILFPRGSGGLGFIMNRSFSAGTGMSDSLSPGSVASLALSNEVAFRVEFPSGGMPAPSGMYWRGSVFSKCDGMNWTPVDADSLWQNPQPLESTPIRQRIVLLPHGDRWIFALDQPVQAPRGMKLTHANVLVANEAVLKTIHYEVISQPKAGKRELKPLERKICLQLSDVSPEVRALVKSWTQGSADPSAVVAKGLQFFRTGKFRYSLEPGEYGQDALDDFLFRRHLGYCEHFAAAFATLMRVAGIPSRLVVGYQGGEYNSLGHYLIVRQSYAHAWCEVYLPSTGWERVDPTAVVTPDRVNSGFDSLASSAGAEGSALKRIGMAMRRRGVLHDLQLAWDTLSFEWDTNVAGFDVGAQQSFLLQLGLFNNKPAALFGWLLLIGGALIAIQSFSAWWKARPVRDPLVILYEQFCQRANALGANRDPSEGPSEFARRATLLIPSQAERIRRIAALYISLRYSATPDGTGKTELAREIGIFCKGTP